MKRRKKRGRIDAAERRLNAYHERRYYAEIERLGSRVSVAMAGWPPRPAQEGS